MTVTIRPTEGGYGMSKTTACPAAPATKEIVAAATTDAEDIRGYLSGIALGFEWVLQTPATDDVDNERAKGFLGNVLIEAFDEQIERLYALEENLRGVARKS